MQSSEGNGGATVDIELETILIDIVIVASSDIELLLIKKSVVFDAKLQLEGKLQVSFPRSMVKFEDVMCDSRA